MRLLQAINEGALSVSEEIGTMEEQMKKEYAGAVRKAKQAMKSLKVVPVESGKGKKRKAEDVAESSKTKVTIRLSDVMVTVDRSTSGAAPSSKSVATMAKSKTKFTAKLQQARRAEQA